MTWAALITGSAFPGDAILACIPVHWSNHFHSASHQDISSLPSQYVDPQAKIHICPLQVFQGTLTELFLAQCKVIDQVLQTGFVWD